MALRDLAQKSKLEARQVKNTSSRGVSFATDPQYTGRRLPSGESFRVIQA